MITPIGFEIYLTVLIAEVLRSTVFISNKSTAQDFELQTALSLSLGYLNRGVEKWWEDYEVGIANSSNFREAQWKMFSLPDLGMDWVGAKSDFSQPGTRASVVKSNLGTFSTSGSLPMGALVRKDSKQSFVWQIEHSGAWRWELGNILHGLYLLGGGPTDQDHQWTRHIKPGDTFESVSTAVAVVEGGIEEAFGALTQYRRCIRRKHLDNSSLPIIFNDFMNCLEGDPDEEKVTSLIEPARKCGAEYFVVDAGWYAEGKEWWDSVGEWKPSMSRFPHGLKVVLDKIRQAGMIPGLWLEVEVMGINCPAAHELPDDAFFQRQGIRVTEQSRYQLDFRHESVTARLDGIIDLLVNEYGVGYFKFDYNIDVTQGTDVNASSPGDGMLQHRRAYMAWVNRIYDRFPKLVLESCASGAQRLDYHMLATHSIQSTSDQTDPVLYAAISAGVPTAVTPEQSASWAYPQPEYSDDLNALCVINSIMGRVHLSGRIDLLNKSQIDLVSRGITAYKNMRHHIKDAVPFWPLGLPVWRSDWVVLGLRNGPHHYLAVWRCGGTHTSCNLPLENLKECQVAVKVLYPDLSEFETGLSWSPESGSLTVSIPVVPSARLLYWKIG